MSPSGKDKNFFLNKEKESWWNGMEWNRIEAQTPRTFFFLFFSQLSLLCFALQCVAGEIPTSEKEPISNQSRKGEKLGRLKVSKSVDFLTTAATSKSNI